MDSHLVSGAERPRTNPQWVRVSSWCPWQRVDCSWWSTPRLKNNPQCFPKRLFSSTLVFTHKHWENMSTAAWECRAGMGTCILFTYLPKPGEWGWDYGATWHTCSLVPPNRGKSKLTAAIKSQRLCDFWPLCNVINMCLGLGWHFLEQLTKQCFSVPLP